MAREKDYAVVAVISDISSKQAAQISSQIMNAKATYAPTGRGTLASGLKHNIGNMLQAGSRKKIGG